jgi:enterochelin esterase-like enzyme
MTFHQGLPAPPAGATGADGHHPVVASLLAHGTPDPSAIDRFFADHEFPLAEPGAVTFAWRGNAGHVELLRWIHGGVERSPFLTLPGTDLWLLRLAVADGGRFEYKLGIGRHGGEDWVLDPANLARAGDPFGENSVCRTFGYLRPDWSAPRGAPSGRIETLRMESAAFGQTREERIYLPAGHDPEGPPCPLVVIHDGSDYMTYADLAVSLDNLIAAGDIPPVIVALVQTRDRAGEYARGRRHARYLVRELLPALAGRYALSPRPEDRVLLGASLGAVASLATAFRYPGTFGGLVLKSGSFILDPAKLAARSHPVFHRVARLVRALHRAHALPGTRAFVSTGELEGLAEENRALATFLRERGVDVLFKSAWDGHHWHNWRDQLRDGLMWVLNRDGEKTG